MHPTSNHLARIGAILFVVWGLLHLVAAHGIYQLASTFRSDLPNGRLVQAAWNLAVFSLQAMVIAVLLNWRNNTIGYWCNVIVVGIVDAGFVLLLIVPGYVAPSAAAFAGPVIYVVAATFSTLGYLHRSRVLQHS